MIQATKNKAKSCSFFDAIRRCSCGRSADWLKIDGREIPASTLETGRYATVRFAAPSSSHPQLSSVCLVIHCFLRVNLLFRKFVGCGGPKLTGGASGRGVLRGTFGPGQKKKKKKKPWA